MAFWYCFSFLGFIWFQWSLQDHSGADAGTGGVVPCPPWRWGLCLLGAQLQHSPPKHCEMYLPLDTSNSQQSPSACAEALGEQGENIRISDGVVDFF